MLSQKHNTDDCVVCRKLYLCFFSIHVDAVARVSARIRISMAIEGGSRDSSVGIATGYGLEDQEGREFESRQGNNFYFPISSRPALGSTQPPIKWVPGALSRG
jgi:hypothetical protein